MEINIVIFMCSLGLNLDKYVVGSMNHLEAMVTFNMFIAMLGKTYTTT